MGLPFELSLELVARAFDSHRQKCTCFRSAAGSFELGLRAEQAELMHVESIGDLLGPLMLFGDRLKLQLGLYEHGSTVGATSDPDNLLLLQTVSSHFSHLQRAIRVRQRHGAWTRGTEHGA